MFAGQQYSYFNSISALFIYYATFNLIACFPIFGPEAKADVCLTPNLIRGRSNTIVC